MFKGLSTLREEERKKQAENKPAGNSALQDYLKKYTGGGGTDDSQGVKKKKKKKADPTSGAVKIIDEDVGLGSAPAGLEERKNRKLNTLIDEEEEGDDFRPVVVNIEEAKVLQRQIQKAQNFYAKDSDGSGWQAADHPSTSGREARGRHDSPDASPPRRGRHDGPDASPPRRTTGAAAPGRHDSPDLSPPRRGRHDSPDASPSRRPAAGGAARHVSRQQDASPPRRARHDSPDASPPRRGGRHDSPDASPPRRPAVAAAAAAAAAGGHDRQQQKQPGDASPPRRRRHGMSPPRRGRHDSTDASPPRRGRHDSPDASPPRRTGGGAEAGVKRRREDDDASPPRRAPAARAAPGPDRMADGTATGLVSARELQAETARMREEAAARRLAAEGRDAQTVYRDRATGRVVTQQEFAETRGKAKGRDDKPKMVEVHLEWKGGLAQRREAEERAARMAAEAAAPFARYADDRERDAILRARTHFGDPMAGVGEGRGGSAEPQVADIAQRYGADKLGKSGFIIPQGIPSHSWLKRGVAAPGNRYNIRPGRHWDGVDRSNGFERQMFAYQANRRALEQEARQWAQGDM